MITKARFYEGETFAEFMARPIKNHELWVALTHRVTIPLEISARVEALHGQWHLLVLNEDWCGDSINIVPIVAKLTESVSNMDMRILARDENLDIMYTHLTGGKSRFGCACLQDFGPHFHSLFCGCRSVIRPRLPMVQTIF